MDSKEFKADFQFLDSWISKSNFNNQFIKIDDEMDLSREIEVSYSTERIEYSGDKLVGRVEMEIKFRIRETDNVPENKRKECNGELIINGLFMTTSAMKDELFDRMLELNGCATLISIARSFVISLSSQALGMGKIVLPLLNIYQMHKKAASTEKKVEGKNK